MSKGLAAQKFLKTENGMNFYHFTCEGCGAEGELEVPVGARETFGCPEGCGATYVQWNNPLTEHPDLQCVVCPVMVPQEERRCRICGCSDDNCAGCIERTGKPCHWVEDDLCSACEAEAKETGL